LDTSTQLVATASQRATPPCPHFGACGGCQLQHLAYSAQLERKAARLRELLSAFALPELQFHASPPLAYRNRIRLTLREVGGQLRAGYLGTAEPHNAGAPSGLRLGGIDPEFPDASSIERAEMSSQEELGAPFMRDRQSAHGSGGTSFVPITQCPIAAPLLWRAADAFLAIANNAAWLRTAQLTPDQLELFTTADESKLQLTLYLRGTQKNPPARLAADFTALCDSLHTHVPELAGAGIALLPSATRTRRIEQPRHGPTWGSAGLTYTVAQLAPRTVVEPRTTNLEPLPYWVPRGAFFQVNRFLLPELVAMVTAAAASRDRALAWDLYAGVGLFSRALARSFAAVTAIEIAEPAATALAQTNLPKLRAVKSTTLDFLRAAVLQRDRPSLIVLDPPRTGLGDEVCSLLARISQSAGTAAPTLVYVSCSPQALARDLAHLTAPGYFVRDLHLFDLFPQTAHVESVAILARS
jgi:23S rRNA (uracil1939-C5)-methyltransferase